MAIEHLSYVFCLSMLHSFWQSGLLLLIYLFCTKTFFVSSGPGIKKSFLLFLLGVQFIFFIVSFISIWTRSDSLFGTSTFAFINESILSSPINRSICYWVFMAYTVVVGIRLTFLSYYWIRFSQNLKHSLIKPAIDLRLFTFRESRHLGIKRKVNIWLSNTIQSPITFGFFKPVILFPVALINQLNLEQAETLILHELTHIRVNDYVVNWLLIFTEHIFFFNPFIHSICKEIRLEREMHCDMNVIGFKYPGILYAETLLLAERFKTHVHNFHLPAVNKKQQLLKRIHFFTNGNNYPYHKGKTLLPFMATSILAFICCITLLRMNPASTLLPEAQTLYPSFTLVATEGHNNELINPAIDYNGLQEMAGKLSSIMQKEEPVIRKKLKKMEPMLKKIRKDAARISKHLEENYALPASLEENDATKEIVIHEEVSGSINQSVRVYTLLFLHGEWVLKPEWKISSGETPVDTSIKNSPESSSKTHFPPQ